MVFAVSADPRGKFLKKEKRQILVPYQRTKKKLWNIKVTPIVISMLGTVPQRLDKRAARTGRVRIEVIQTTAVLRSVRILRTPGDLRRLAVTQTPKKDNQVMLV